MKAFTRTATSVLAALLLGLLVGIPATTESAYAANEITKTINVKDSSGNALAGALVAVGFADTASPDGWHWTDPVTSNSNGQAILTGLPQSTDYSELYVEPAITDTVDAFGFANTDLHTFSLESSTVVNINLQQATVHLNLTLSNGNPSPIHTWVSYPNDSSQNYWLSPNLLRTGSFGLALDPSLNCDNNGGNWSMQFGYGFTSIGNPDSDFTNYNMRATTCETNRTLSFTNVLGVTPPSPDGVWQLHSNYRAFNFTVVSPTDSTTALKQNSWLEACATVNNNDSCTNVAGGSKGGFGLPDGTYKVRTHPGDTNYAMSLFTVTVSNGGTSFTAKVGSPATSQDVPTNNGRYIFAVANPNFVTNLIHSVDNSPFSEGLSYSYFDYTGDQQGNWLGGDYLQSGVGHFNLPDGKYLFAFDPNGSDYAETKYVVNVSGGTPSVYDIAGNLVTTNVGINYSLPVQISNFKFSVLSPANSSPLSYVFVDACPQNGPGNCFGGRTMGDGSGGIHIPDGTWMLRTHADQYSQYAEKDYVVTFSGGTLSAISPSVTPVNGIYGLTLSTANFYLKIVSPTGNSAAVQGYFEYCADLGNGNAGPCNGIGVGPSGLGSASLANGNWLIRVHPDQSNTQYAMATYSVTVSNGVPTMNTAGVTLTNGYYPLAVAVPNVSGTITDPTGGAITFGNGIGVSVNLQQQNGDHWDYTGQGIWAQGSYALNVTTAGTYRLIFEPQGLSQFASTFSPQFTVNINHTISVVGGGSATNLNVRLATPNLKFEVHNPLDNSLLPYGYIQIQKVLSQNNTQWIQNANLNPSLPGLVSANLADGTYQITVNPPNGSQSIPGLAPYMYTATISGNTVTLLDGTSPVATNISGAFIVQPASANITGRIVDASGTGVGSGNGVWVNVGVQQLQNGVNWNWLNINAQTDQDGYFGIYLKDVGTYRLRVQPQGRSDVSTTYSSQFTITSDSGTSFKQDFGSIIVPAPNLQIKVVRPNSSTADQNINIDIQSNNRWVDNIWIDQSGLGSTNLTAAGTYQLTLHPNGDDAAAGSAQKSYTATVTNNNGIFEVAIAGVTPVGGVYTLPLGTATISGTVFAPSDTTPVWNAQVVAVDQATGQELWQNSTGTNSSGNWAMALPAGTYKVYARAPWGTATMSDSAKTSTFTVDNSGNVTSGISRPVSIHLKNPTWSGLLKSPDSSTVIANGTVCLNYQSGGNSYGSCINTDDQGRWAFSGPDGFSSFDASASLRANENNAPQYGSLTLNPTALNAKLGTSGSNIVLNLPTANVIVHVVDAANAAVPNVWINIDRDNAGWLGAGSTDQNGNAHLYVSDLTKNINVQVDVNSNPDIAATYSGVRKAFSDSYVNTNSAGSPRALTLNITLPHPNVAGIVHDPATGSIAPFTWVDVFDATKNQSMGGQGTNQDGYFSLNAPAPASGTEHYVIGVNPSGQGSSLSARKTYSLDVNSDNSVVLMDEATQQAPSTELHNGSQVTTFALALPSVSGVVNDSSGQREPYAWVQPYNLLTSQWMGGYGVRQQGQFGLALADGQYRLQANPSSQATGQAPSDYCFVTVANGGVTNSAGGCISPDKSLVLALRPPNFHITVHDPLGATLAYANVGVCVASWCTNAQADASGVASLFIDKGAILAASSYLTSGSPDQNMTLWIDPPYGTSSVVRTQCNSLQSGTACQSLPKVSLVNNFNDYSATFTMKGPNIHAAIKDPSGNALGTNFWATLYSLDIHGDRQWLGNGGTDSDGNVAFLVDTSTVSKVVLEVDVPNTVGQSYANTIWDNNGVGYNPQDLASATLHLATPNLKITSLAFNSLTSAVDTNTYGWAMVEKFDTTTNQPIQWVSSFGLNDQGQAAINLAASTTYRLTVFPGPNKSGAGTACLLRTNSAGTPVVSLVSGGCLTGTLNSTALSLTLSHGNTNGTVTDASNKPVVGAIVTAQVGSDTSTTIVTSTDANGTFGMNLTGALSNWTIKVIPFNPPTGTQLAVWSSTGSGITIGASMSIRLVTQQ
jgi:hypothetical protein